jgi:hypothetical protein
MVPNHQPAMNINHPSWIMGIQTLPKGIALVVGDLWVHFVGFLSAQGTAAAAEPRLRLEKDGHMM